MDGFEDPYWNLLQVIAWVYLRDREYVRRASDDFTDHGSFRQEFTLPDGRTELVKTPARRPTLGTLMVARAVGSTGGCGHYEEARDLLLHALRGGSLRCWGRRYRGEDLQEIPAIQWTELTFREDKHGRPYAAQINQHRIKAVSWRNLQFLRAEVLSIWPDLSDAEAGDVEPLISVQAADLKSYAARDTWTLTQALYLIHGNQPPDWECSTSLATHFPEAYQQAVNSIHSGTIGRKIIVAGKSKFIAPPTDWLGWADRKNLAVAESVRAAVAASSRMEYQPTPLSVVLEETPDLRDWSKVTAHRLEDCILYLMNVHRKQVPDRGPNRDEFDRLLNLAMGAIVGGQLRAKQTDGTHWIKRPDFLAWARGRELHLDNLDHLENEPDSVSPDNRTRQGRPPSSGSYAADDAAFIAEMHTLISHDQSLSPTGAAAKIVGNAKGAGTDESKIKRLVRQYRDKYSETQR